jgi:hypothetical protein
MGRRINNGIELSKQSWAALRQNPQLLMFPTISMIGMIIVTVLFFIPLAALVPGYVDTRSGNSSSSDIVALIVLFLYYFLTYTVIIFSNTALVGAAMKLIRGEPATVQDGLNIAFARIGKIIVYALISATVGVIARSIRESGRRSNNLVVAIIAAIIGGLIQGAWNLVVFFVIPVLVVENVGVVDSLKRSWELWKQTWGEQFTGSVVIGGISCLIYIAVFLVGGALIIAAAAAGSVALAIIVGVIMVLTLVFLGLISGAVNGIFQSSLYLYATTGDAGRFISTDLAREAFVAA